MNESDIPSEFDLSTYHADHSHRRHAAGRPQTTAWVEYFNNRPKQRMKQVYNRLRFCGLMDMAWLIMLYEQGLVDASTVAKLRPALEKSQDPDETGWGGEEWIRGCLPDHDADAAAAVNYGRTLQEPMSRMMEREELQNIFDELLLTRQRILDKAAANVETVMAGHSHRAHAQPTTWAAYLLAVHDQLVRGEELLEVTYAHTNRNTGGCGACSGTGWPVDRNRVTELLGFDQTVELTYDCEGSMDHHLTILFAASNIATTLSRTAMDHNLWMTEEWNIMTTPPAWRGVSSFMPQKAHPGSHFERIRMQCNEVIGQMQVCMMAFKNEPIQDVLPVYQSEKQVIKGLAYLEGALGLFHSVLPHIRPNRERMRQLLREGFSGAPDLAITLIRRKGYGGRVAHRICATMVRIARERGIKPYECTATLLKEAARISADPEPDVTDEEVQEAMGLESFFEKHDNLGDPNPAETTRLIQVRLDDLERSRQRQRQRRQKVHAAIAGMRTRYDEIAAKGDS
jgi:argininosuccinate lyase